MILAIVLVILVIGSVLFHIFSPWQATEAASNWGSIDSALLITIVITGIFFVGIGLFMAVAVWRFHHSNGKRAAYEPESKKLEWWLIIITSVGIMGMLAPGLVVYNDFVQVPEDATELEVFGQQWQWAYRYPGDDGALGTADVQWVSAQNPLGINPEDPQGQDDVIVVSNEVHLPIGQPVKVLLRSKDVLHDFYVPQIRSKMDMVPGLVSYFWFTPTKTGRFEVLCAEFCGVGHYNMRGMMVVDDPPTFNQWLAKQTTFAQSQINKGKTASSNRLEQGRQLAESLGCIACHSQDGSKSLGPGWKDLYGKTETLTDGSTVVVDDDYIKESIRQPKTRMVQGYPPVMVSYDLDEDNLNALIAVIKSLSGIAVEGDTGQGNTDNMVMQGQQVAQEMGCTACHSDDGSMRVGPSWKGLFGTTETLNDGSKVAVDEAYLRESIVNPNAKVVHGYSPMMPTLPMDEEKVDVLVAYLKSLGG